MKTKLRKNRNGTFSVVFKDANGRSRSVATNATQRGEAMTLAKRADIQKMQIASEAGLLRNQVASLMMSGKKMGCIDAANEYLGTLEWGRHRQPWSTPGVCSTSGFAVPESRTL